MSETFLIISDLHLGREPSRATAKLIRPVWRGADHLIINGDAAELCDPRFIDPAREQALQLQDLCEKDGVTLTLLPGNHDPLISDQQVLFLVDGAVMIMHGDTIHPAIAPWCETAPVMREAFEKAMNSFPVETHEKLETRLAATRQAAIARWQITHGSDVHMIGFRRMLYRPWAFLQVLDYWRRFPSEAAEFLERFAPQAKVLITGHSHHQGQWRRGGRTIINTGAYSFPGKPRVVKIVERQITVHNVARDEAGYRVVEKTLSEIVV